VVSTVSLDALCKRYDGGGELAVKDVSLTVEDGEFMVLLGPSGCGKSSVLRMIAGLEPITAGTVSIDGRVINQVAAKDRDIAMVFQSYALYPHMDVYHNLAFGLRRRGVPAAEIDRRVRGAAEKLGLATLLARKPHALSGGQRQRVAVGRAIVRDPKVFLFDEPLSNLDASLRVTMRNELIKQQHELGITTIYVTHDQVEAMTMGHRICIMNGGAVVQVGTPMEVYGNPADIFVARFLGNPPMNLLPGRLAADGGRATVGLAGGTLDLPGWPGGLAGAAVTVGIRPEDLYEPGGNSGSAMGRLAATVVTVEPLGAETLVLLAVGAERTELIARLGRRTALSVGAAVAIAVDCTAIHLFDAATGKAIPKAGPVQREARKS
jgi:multiple sugar transport system ATP-binding protein